MNPKLLHDLGRCFLEAQVVEYWLSVLFLLERDKQASGAHDRDASIESLVVVRAECNISALKEKLQGLGVPVGVLVDLDQAAKRRNHLAHRIVHDGGFLRALGDPSSGSTFDDDLRLFTDCRDRLEEYYHARASELNVSVSRSPTSSVDQIYGFAEQVLDGIQRRRKEI